MQAPPSLCEAFVSAPIKLAAKIIERRRSARDTPPSSPAWSRRGARGAQAGAHQRRKPSGGPLSYLCLLLAARSVHLMGALALAPQPSGQLVWEAHEENSANSGNGNGNGNGNGLSQAMRHRAHYLNFVPSAHFSYHEGRQAAGRSLEAPAVELEALASHLEGASLGASHIYKRSSALLPGGGLIPSQTAPADSSNHQHQHQQLVGSGRVPLKPLSRRMMAPGNSAQPSPEGAPQLSWLGVAPAPDQSEQQEQQIEGRRPLEGTARDLPVKLAAARLPAAARDNGRKQWEREQELLRQKQHIQYHDQGPSAAGRCHKRTLNFCASVLPFNSTTFPNIIGDTNRFEVKRSLPFFGFLAKSACNKRLDELLCLLLEPPCALHSGLAIPPCKKFCRLALEGCNEYIPATLALSSVFDCRQYPDSSEPSVCVNPAQGSKCAPDEFKCPDKTCIPRNWLCDGVRDCIFAADEANCTATQQASVCSTEEFQCDGKCVPKAWRCDGERDCLDGSDEAECDLRPRCGPDRFQCADGNGCIPKRWACDGKAECRDGSDELNCDQRQCSDSDFKCDNGICIPKLWRCDRQPDCRDGSDERQCVYPTPPPAITSTSTSTSTPIEATTAPASTTSSASSSPAPADNSTPPSATQAASRASEPPAQEATEAPVAGAAEQLELGLASDVARIIQSEREAAPATTQLAVATSAAAAAAAGTTESGGEPLARPTTVGEPLELGAELAPHSKDMNKFDYELIASGAAANLVQLNELAAPSAPLHLGEQPPGGAPPQQRQQQQQPREMNGLMKQATGQLARGHKFARQPLPPLGPVQPQHQHQRLPIYRSLFKSFKGQHGQQQQPGERRNVVAVARRRRDRHQHLALVGEPAPQSQPEQPGSPVAPSSGSARHDQPEPQLYNQTRPHSIQLHQQQQQQQQQVPRQLQAGHAGAAVASYLQLLNSRYNLRLPRVGSLGPA